MTLLRNATTKKNRHCYGVKLSTDSNILLRDLEKPVTAMQIRMFPLQKTFLRNRVSDVHYIEFLNNISCFMTEV